MRKITAGSLLLLGIISGVLIGRGTAGRSETAMAEERNSLENRLRQMEDREAVHQLLMDYGRFLDSRDFASFSRLFSGRDGEWEGGMGKAKGSEEIRKLMEQTIGSTPGKAAPAGFHIFTNETFRINGDRAEAFTRWIFMVPGESGRPQPMILGHYKDTMVREADRWRFLRREVHADIPDDRALSRSR